MDRLMNDGRPDELVLILKEMQKRQYIAGNGSSKSDKDRRLPQLGGLATAAAEFADGLTTARVPLVLTELAGKLDEAIDRAKPDIEGSLPLLLGQLDELKAWCKPIRAKRCVSEEGVNATLELAGLYRRLQRFSEWSALLREVVVAAHSAKTRSTPLQPGESEFSKQHNRDADSLAGDSGPLGRAWSMIANVRNDVQHAAYRDKPLTPRGAIRALGRLDSAVRDSIRQALTAKEDSVEPAQGPFVNCSNHPSDRWSPEQRKAALALGCNSIKDIPFPSVAPDAGTDAALAIARELAASLISLKPSAAFIAGEISVATAVTVKLQDKRIPCFAATTMRTVTEDIGADGKVVKTAVFKFVSWRRIPDFDQMEMYDDAY